MRIILFFKYLGSCLNFLIHRMLPYYSFQEYYSMYLFSEHPEWESPASFKILNGIANLDIPKEEFFNQGWDDFNYELLISPEFDQGYGFIPEELLTASQKAFELSHS